MTDTDSFLIISTAIVLVIYTEDGIVDFNFFYSFTNFLDKAVCDFSHLSEARV